MSAPTGLSAREQREAGAGPEGEDRVTRPEIGGPAARPSLGRTMPASGAAKCPAVHRARSRRIRHGNQLTRVSIIVIFGNEQLESTCFT